MKKAYAMGLEGRNVSGPEPAEHKRRPPVAKSDCHCLTRRRAEPPRRERLVELRLGRCYGSSAGPSSARALLFQLGTVRWQICPWCWRQVVLPMNPEDENWMDTKRELLEPLARLPTEVQTPAFAMKD